MQTDKEKLVSSHWFTRALILFAAGICLLLGVVGIVLPVIPGILFLVLAIWLIARISTRTANYLNSHPQWQRQQRFWDRARHLSLSQRAQLGFWLAGRMLVEGSKNLLDKISARLTR